MSLLLAKNQALATTLLVQYCFEGPLPLISSHSFNDLSYITEAFSLSRGQKKISVAMPKVSCNDLRHKTRILVVLEE